MIANVPRLSPGDELAGYRIEGVAGEGGMGVVYRATHLELGRPVALKLIASELAGDADFRARFKREAQLAASLDHPNVIPVYGAGEHNGVLMLSMRYVDGIDLGSFAVRSGGLSPARAVAIVGQIAAALDAAHAKGLVHRDVKPQNVLLTGKEGEEHAYLTDFGLTKQTGNAAGVTRTGSFLGTPDFVAPEQIHGRPLDGRADVYALGCVLYTIVALRPPFGRESDIATLHAHLHDPPPRLTDAARGVPPGLDDVIARALAKEPADRYQSAGDLVRAARAALEAGDDPAPLAAARDAEAQAAGLAAARDASAQAAELAAARGGSHAGAPPAKRRTGRDRGAQALTIALPAIVICGLLAAVLAAAGVLGGGESAKESPGAAGGAEATPTATPTPTPTPAPTVAQTIDAGEGPDGVIVQEGRVFVADSRGGTLNTFDAESGEAAGEPIDVGRRPDGITGGRGVVWVAGAGSDQVVRLQLEGERLVATARVPVGDSPEGIALGAQLAWVANRLSGTVSRIDRATPSVLGPPIGVGTEPTGIFVGSRYVWVTNNGDDTVSRIDGVSAEVVGDPIPVGKRPRGVVEGLGSVWVANSRSNTVSRLDRRTGEPIGDPIPVGENPRELAVGLGAVWVTNKNDNSVTRIDPETGRVVGSPIPVGTRPIGIDVARGSVWVGNFGDGTVSRIEP